jgi:hypothetical protein
MCRGRSKTMGSANRPAIGHIDGDVRQDTAAEPEDELVATGDFLARAALKALLEIATSIDSRVARGTELQLSDALAAWADVRRAPDDRAAEPA